MITKPVTPKAHAIIDYALAGSLLVLPSVLKLNKKVRAIYAAEALILLPYIALTEQPAALKPVIPFTMHGKIDPFNIAQFALQTGLKPFRRQKKAVIFNLVFTAIAGATVLLTDWNGRTTPK